MTTIGVPEIRRFRPGAVTEIAVRLDGQRRRVGRAMELLLLRRATGLAWSGPASSAAAERHAEVIGALTGVAARIGASARVLDGLAERMASCLQLLRHAERVARDGGGWLDENGHLLLPARVPTGDLVTDSYLLRADERVRQEVDHCLAQARRVADATDVDVHRALVGAATAQSVATAPADGLPLVPPPQLAGRPGGGVDVPADQPFATAAWWRSLSPGEQRRVIRERPTWVGPRDGIPAADRHAANLVLLEQARAAARSELRRLSVPGEPVGDAVTLAAHRAASLDALAEVAARRDGHPRQLLLVDATGPVVRAAVSLGDVDTAGHVTTFVGGVSTTVDGDLARLDDRFGSLRTMAWTMTRGSGAAADVAVVSWIGYPAPQWRQLLSGGPGSPVSQRAARDNAGALASFVNGLDAARPVAPHQTLWAHSYGSVVGGYALKRNTGVDDVLFYGSPGTPIAALPEAGLKRGSFNVLASGEWDIVAMAAPFGDPLEVPGAMVLSASAAAKPGEPNRCLLPSRGHSEYDRRGSTAEHNLAAVAAGRPDLRVVTSGGCR